VNASRRTLVVAIGFSAFLAWTAVDSGWKTAVGWLFVIAALGGLIVGLPRLILRQNDWSAATARRRRVFWGLFWLLGLAPPALFMIFVVGDVGLLFFILGLAALVMGLTYAVWRFAHRSAKPS
jgi:hypothetical protein